MNDPLNNKADNNDDTNNSQRHQPQITEPPRFFADSDIQSQLSYDLAQQRQSNSMIDSQQRTLTAYNHITYLLYVLSYFTAGLLWIVPIVMNYIKRHDADNTWLATHFDWQIKTFWYSIVGFVIGTVILLSAFGVLGIGTLANSSGMTYGSMALGGFGVFIIGITVIWHLYRIVRGWIALTDNRPVP